MLRRKFAAAAVVLCTGFIATTSYADDFQSKYYDLILSGDWMHQRIPANQVPPGANVNLFASKKFGEGVMITVMPSNVDAKDAANKMAQSYKQSGMLIIDGPKQMPGQNSYQFTYISANKKMHSITFVTSNGKTLSQISVLGRQGVNGTELLKGLKSKEEGLFPKF